MDIIVGSSRAKFLSPAKSFFTETWFRPGGRINDMNDLVDDHFMKIFPLCPVLANSKNFVYVVCGICDITEKLSNNQENYQEIIYTKDPNSNIQQMKNDYHNLKHYILQHNLIPVLATIIPTDITKANHFYLDKGKTSALHHTQSYDDMQQKIFTVCEEMNKFICEVNLTTQVRTLSLHTAVYHNTKNGKKYFKPTHLFDGIHANQHLTSKFNHMLQLTINNNRV
jgi:hypothetical protein